MKKQMLITALGALIISGVKVFSADQAWQTNFEQASKDATEKKLQILAVFTGSDWCPWCIKLEKEVLGNKEFITYTKDKFTLFMADFPSSSKLPEKTASQNKELASKYKVEGFPTVLILSGDGKVIAKTGYRAGGPAKYAEHLNSLTKIKNSGHEK